MIGRRGVRVLLWVPLLAFLVFLGMVAAKLVQPGDSRILSHLVGKPMPGFALPPAASDRPGLASGDLVGRPHLVNIFASWCGPCAIESPVLVQMARRGVPIDGIAIRDTRADVDAFLARGGNPYRRIGSDVDSSVQLALGSSGVPETFVVDARGIIRHQHVGDIKAEDVPGILAALAAAR